MKFRQILAVIGVVALILILLGATRIMTSKPREYGFMGDAQHVRAFVQEDGSPVGREASFYLIHKPVQEVLPEAEKELAKKNFKPAKAIAGTSAFQRGRGDRVEIHSAKGCGHTKVVSGIPEAERDQWTVVKTVDPRMRRAIVRWFIDYNVNPPAGG